MDKLFKEIDVLQKEINSFRPLPPETVKQLKDYYRVGLTYSSNALEGNSLTETETKVILEDGITIGGKPIKDYYEAVGHSEAYDFMNSQATLKDFTEDSIKMLHKLFYNRINEAEAGKYRKSPGRIFSYSTQRVCLYTSFYRWQWQGCKVINELSVIAEGLLLGDHPAYFTKGLYQRARKSAYG